MTLVQPDDPTRSKPIRRWPGVVAVAVQWLTFFGLPFLLPRVTTFSTFHARFAAVAVGVLCGLAVAVWWTFFSRAPRVERWSAVILMILAVWATSHLVHESVANVGMGTLFPIYSILILSLAFVVWAVACSRLNGGLRLATMVATILLACGAWTLVRVKGVTGDASPLIAWRWEKSAEERLMAHPEDEPTALPSTPAMDAAADWPGFRGPGRDSIVRGVRIETDWSASPPVELWRRAIGPGVSSFAVGGGRLYTQEQRGDDEEVACYSLSSGQPVWRHHDSARFWESHAGAGPRGTPTLAGDRLYTFGATGIVNAFDAGDGTLLWSRNAASDTQVKLPPDYGWYGFASSPLVVGDLIVVAASGALVAYDRAGGDPRWFGPASRTSYSSPQLVTIDGVAQILQLSFSGVISLAPDDGRLLWEHPLPGGSIVQPALTADGDLLVSVLNSSAMPIGIRRIAVDRRPDGWTVQERWTSNRLKPYFSPFVVHGGSVYGFDGSILACIDLEDGQRQWKGGRYGQGQLILLSDQDLMLVVSEQGEVALVSTTPDPFRELARLPAIEGRTWNHPALVGDILLVRNSQEMAAFRLTLRGGSHAKALSLSLMAGQGGEESLKHGL